VDHHLERGLPECRAGRAGIELDVDSASADAVSGEALVADVDHSALQRNVSRRTEAGPWFKDGPASLLETLQWPKAKLDSMKFHDTVHGTKLVAELEQSMLRDVVVTLVVLVGGLRTSMHEATRIRMGATV